MAILMETEMHKLILRLLLVSLVLLLAGCDPKTAPRPGATAVLQVPAQPTLKPTPTPFPTPNEPAPERTFTAVGNVAELNGSHGITGRAVVAGLQTLIIQSFTFDGKGPQADIRLVKGQDYKNPAIVLLKLDQRAYEGEVLLLLIPSTVQPGSADSIAVYCPETDEVYASGLFQ